MLRDETVMNNLLNLFPIIAGGSLFFIGLGRLMVPSLIGEEEADAETTVLDRLWVTAAVMCGLSILVVYILVALKLYEVLSLVAVYLALAVYLFRRRISGTAAGWKVIRDQIVVLVLDILEQRVRMTSLLKDLIIRGSLRGYKKYLALPQLWIWLGLLLVLGAAAYLRFGDPVTHLAPAMSDSYVNIAWVKYIERQILFHDGLYTHGFHIYLSVLHKFSAVNILYLINSIGPLNGVLITFSLYYTARRLTGSQGGGLMAALVYGVFLGYLPAEAARQSATNSQEFALVWLAPALYWSWRYLQSGKKYWLWAAAGGVAVIVFTHAMVSIFAGVGLVVTTLTGWAGARQDYIRRCWRLTVVVGLTGLVCTAPLLMGRLLGIQAHQTSLEFLTGSGIFALPSLNPPLSWLLVLVLAGGALAAITAGWRGQRLRGGAAVFSLALLGSAAAIYMGPSWGLTFGDALQVRSGELISLVLALGAAWPAALLHEMIAFPFRRAGWRNLTALLLVAAIAYLGISRYPPRVFQPYYMQHDAAVKTYLRITREFRPTLWTMVAPYEFYALVLGLGWHVPTADFLKEDMAWRDGYLQGNQTKTAVDNLFIFLEKVPCPAPIDDLTEDYEERARQEAELSRRLAVSDWAGAGEVYYEDNQLIVYHYHYEVDDQERIQRIWDDNPLYRVKNKAS